MEAGQWLSKKAGFAFSSYGQNQRGSRDEIVYVISQA